MKALVWLAVGIAIGVYPGALAQNHIEKLHQDAVANEPLAEIGVALCKNFLGVVVVSKDGKVHPKSGITPEQAIELAKGLPETSLMAVMIPCPGTST